MRAKSVSCLVACWAVIAALVACGAPPVGPPPPPNGFSLSGTVNSRGAGLSGVQVVLSGDASNSARTDGRGTFVFSNVAGNHFFVTPSFEGYRFTPANYEIGSGARADLNFTADSTSGNVGDVATDFTGTDQNGRTFSLSSCRGKVVLINISEEG